MIKSYVSLALLFIFVIAQVFSAYPTKVHAALPQYDIIIRNGRVIDGSGSPGFKADVAIKGDRIVRIGNLRGVKAKREIDARGQIVAPGFVDRLGQADTFVLIE